MSTITLSQWRAAIDGAANEIASYALSFTGALVQDPVALERAASLIGAHIPLIGDGKAYDMAFVAAPESCKALARAILQMAYDAPIQDTEVADAIGEIVNMLGGGVKRRMSAGNGADLVLGLPIFLHGYIQPTARMTVTALPVKMGTIDTMVLIAGQRG